MIVDSSAIVAVVFREPGFATLLAKLASADGAGIGAPTAAETAIVLAARLRRDCRGILERPRSSFDGLRMSGKCLCRNVFRSP